MFKRILVCILMSLTVSCSKGVEQQSSDVTQLNDEAPVLQVPLECTSVTDGSPVKDVVAATPTTDVFVDTKEVCE